MANRKIIDNGLGTIGNFPPITLTESGFTEQQVAWLSSALSAITEAINGNLSLGNADHASRGGNFRAQWVQQLFTSANVEVEIPHGLGRKAADVFFGLPSAAARFYTARRGSWTESTIWVACDTPGITVPILIF
jgi:hypothetical protein